MSSGVAGVRDGVPAIPAGGGLSTVELCQRAGLSLRQAHYWREKGVIVPCVPAHGSGSKVRWSDTEAQVAGRLRAISALLGDEGHGVHVPIALLARVARELRHMDASFRRGPGERVEVGDATVFLSVAPIGSGR